MAKKFWLLLPMLTSINCLPYVYHMRERVLVGGIDVGSTLEIARTELEEGGFDAVLTIWAIRDQLVSVDHARTISALYFTHIDRVAAEKDKTVAAFGVWHLAWAISNFYRNGDDGIKAELQAAYRDAVKRPATLSAFKDVATEHVNGGKVYMGDFHGAARAYARTHIVAPGVKGYLQSLDEYRINKAKEKRSLKEAPPADDASLIYFRSLQAANSNY